MKKDYLKIFILRTIGNFLLLSAVVGIALTLAPAVGAEVNYRYELLVKRQYYVAGGAIPAAESQNVTNLLASAEPPLPIVPLDVDFGIVIPKIGANARIIPDVDPGDEEKYLEALKHGVAHAAGTANPGEVGNVFLFAHSVGNFWEVNRWNAVFYLLRELSAGDEVDIFYHGSRYIYQVYGKRLVEPEDVGYLSAQANFPMLTLQTCWPPGTTLKRLLVFARLKSS